MIIEFILGVVVAIIITLILGRLATRALVNRLEKEADEKIEGFKAQQTDRQSELYKEINSEKPKRSRPDKQ